MYEGKRTKRREKSRGIEVEVEEEGRGGGRQWMDERRDSRETRVSRAERRGRDEKEQREEKERGEGVRSYKERLAGNTLFQLLILYS